MNISRTNVAVDNKNTWIYQLDKSLEDNDAWVMRLNKRVAETKLEDPDCTIFRVSCELQAVDPISYEPRILSLGPYHHGKPHLRAMEEHKWRSLKILLERSERRNLGLKDYIKLVADMETRTRKAYSEAPNMDSKHWVEMMLLDGCFVVEVLNGMSHTINKWIHPFVMRDMLLLENQLPFFFLVELHKLSCLEGQNSGSLVHFTLRTLGTMMPGEFRLESDLSIDEIHHVIHLLYSCILPEQTLREPCLGSPPQSRLLELRLDLENPPEPLLDSLPVSPFDSELLLDSLPEPCLDNLPDIENPLEPLLDSLPVPHLDNEPLLDSLPEPCFDNPSDLENPPEPLLDSLPVPLLDSEPLFDSLPEPCLDNPPELLLDSLPELCPDLDSSPESLLDSPPELCLDRLMRRFCIDHRLWKKLWKFKWNNQSQLEKWVPSAKNLRDAGVVFQMKKNMSSFTEITFRRGKLEIPQLRILDSCNSVLRNLLAFEQCHNGYMRHTNLAGYAYLMGCIINTPADVDILQQDGIIVNFLGNDDDMARLFNQLSKNLVLNPHYLADVVIEINLHCNKRESKWKASINHKYCYNPCATASIVAAFFLFLLTITQTVFAVLRYVRSP